MLGSRRLANLYQNRKGFEKKILNVVFFFKLSAIFTIIAPNVIVNHGANPKNSKKNMNISKVRNT
jgi:hypothetical protein